MQKSNTKNFKETQELGESLAKEILVGGIKKIARVLALRGNLGDGKTTFLQGFARGLGIAEVVNSPTFLIMKKFKIPNSNFSFFYHLDLYRLENEQDLEFINFQEIFADPKNIIAIEWPERVEKLLPKEVIKIIFNYVQENTREIKIDKF